MVKTTRDKYRYSSRGIIIGALHLFVWYIPGDTLPLQGQHGHLTGTSLSLVQLVVL